MDLDIALKTAKDLESSPEQLDALFGQNEEVDRLLAGHPKASADLLEGLSHSSDRSTRRYVVGNPNATKEVLVKLAPQFPGDFFKNPAFDWLLIEQPNLMFEIGGGVLKNVLKRPECPASFMNWAAAHGSEQERLAVAMNPSASVEALQAIERKGGKAEQAARQHANHPDSRGEDDLEAAFRGAVAQAIDEGFWQSDMPTLAQWPALSVAQRLESAGLLEHCVEYAKHPLAPPELASSILSAVANSGHSWVYRSSRHLAEEYVFYQVRWKFSRNSAIPSEILATLAGDSDHYVRREVARNTATSADILNILSVDHVAAVRREVALNAKTPGDIVRKVIGAFCQQAYQVIVDAMHSTWWISAVAKLKPKDFELIAACKVGDILFLPDKAVEKACRKKLLAWRLIGLSHRLAPLGVLTMSAHSIAWAERMAVARNPSTPLAVIQLLQKDAHRTVARQAEATAKLRFNQMERQSQLLQYMPDESAEQTVILEISQRLKKRLSLDARIFGSSWGKSLAPGQWTIALDAARQLNLETLLPNRLKTAIGDFWADSSRSVKIPDCVALPSTLAILAKPSRKKNIQEAVACDVNTPIEVLLSLASSRYKVVRSGVAGNFTASVESLAILARDSDVDVRLGVARNSATSVEILTVLASDPDVNVRLGVAQNSAVPLEILAILARDSDVSIRLDIARNSSTPSYIRIPLISELSTINWHVNINPRVFTAKLYYSKKGELPTFGCEVRMGIASSRTTPAEILIKLAGDADENVRLSVARNSVTPIEGLIALAGDTQTRVRRAVAENPATPASSLKVLACDLEPDDDLIAWGGYGVRCAVARNPATPTANLKVLVGDCEPEVRRAVAENPASPVDILAVLAVDSDSGVRYAAAGNPATPAMNLKVLAGDCEPEVRYEVAGNPASSTEILMKLSVDSDFDVREKVMRNPTTPIDIYCRLLAERASDSDFRVRREVASNPFTPSNILTVLCEDASLEVFINAANNPNAPAEVFDDTDHEHMHRPAARILIKLHQALGAGSPSRAQSDFIQAWMDEMQASLMGTVALHGLEDDEFRLAFLELGLIPADSDMRAIVKASKSADWLQRVATTYVIGVPASLLKSMLEDPVETVRQSATWRLRSMGAAAKHRASLTSNCPNCKGTVKEDNGNYACCGVEGAASGCGFSFNKTQSGRAFKPAEVEVLLRSHKSGLLRGFISKAGKPFNAEMVLRFDEAKKTCRLVFDFVKDKKLEPVVLAASTAADVAPQPSLGACPKCGAAVYAHGTNYVCTNSLASPAQAVPNCDFKTGQVILQQAISAEQLSKLLTSGRTDLLDGFISARTQKAFKAMLVWDGKAGKVGFEFGSSRG